MGSTYWWFFQTKILMQPFRHILIRWVGAIIRDTFSQVMTTWSKPFALGLNLEWACDVGLNLKTDALVVENGLKNTIRHSSEICDLLADVSNLLSLFHKAEVSHVLCSFNNASHDLRRYALWLVMNVFSLRKIHLQQSLLYWILQFNNKIFYNPSPQIFKKKKKSFGY